MKQIFLLVSLGCALFAAAQTPVPVTVKVHSRSGKTAIPDDFVGLSFGMKALLPDAAGNHFFSPTNQPLVSLFRAVGIRHLRLGGTSVEAPPDTPIPDNAAIDDVFGFAEAAGVKNIIYSLRLLETNAALHYDVTNAAIARYIWEHHRAVLDCFSLGNEPNLTRVFNQDVEITNFTTYLAKWRRFAAVITNAVPEARFAGPDGGSGTITWTVAFATEERRSGILKTVTEHYYPGGPGRNVPPARGIDDMLSVEWAAKYENLFKKMARPISEKNIPCRFTEANDHYSGGIKDASDTFAGALWALDFLHWWAAHGIAGVDFHNTEWVSSDVVTVDASHHPILNPKAYGLKAFDLSSRGIPEPVTIRNRNKINLSAYAVHGADAHFVTLINREHGPNAPDAVVTISSLRNADQAQVIFLSAPGGDVAAKTGVTLGGAPLTDSGPWLGEWRLISTGGSDRSIVTVPPASAAIVRIPAG